MKRRYLKPWLAALPIAALLAGVLAPVASAAPTLTPGQVIAVSGSTYTWVADDQGTVHLVGDTRALADRPVDWDARTVLSLDQLRTLPRGEPWLSAGLVQIGSGIYLPKWETDESAPTLFHVQSPADLEVFGINGQNYTELVMEPDTWEQRFGFSPFTLPRDELPALAEMTQPDTGTSERGVSQAEQNAASAGAATMISEASSDVQAAAAP